MVEVDAILLRSSRLSDTSLIVHWLTSGQGLVKTVAKGALRPKSSFSGKLDLFFSGEIIIVPAKKGDLHLLKEVTISHWRQGLRRQYATTLMAAYFCQLVESSLEQSHVEPTLHDLLRRGLDHLDKSEPSLKALHHFEKQLMACLGIASSSKPEGVLLEYIGCLPIIRKDLIDRLAPN